MDNEIELTELTDLDVERQDGVASPASGFTFLVKKSAAPACSGDCCDNCGNAAEPAAKDTNSEAEEAEKGEMENENTETSEVTETPAPAVEKAAFDALSERVTKMESDLAEAIKQRDDAKAAEAAAKSELEVLKATPLPGGPALAATAADRDFRAKNEAVAKAAYYRRQAETTSDRELAVEYIKRANALDAQAK